MSKYEWESGTIKLPTAEFARVRKAVESAAREYDEAVFAKTQDFWRRLSRKQQTDPGAYAQAVHEYDYAVQARLSELSRSASWGPYSKQREAEAGQMQAVHRQAYSLLSRGISMRYVDGKPVYSGKPRRVQASDMNYPTNRTTQFRLGDASIVFDKESSTVQWEVGENNHAVESAHGDPRAVALWRALDSVRWTRGTGGVISGNDEYNLEARASGGGANYVTRGIGPVGASDPAAWSRTTSYRDSTGKVVTLESFPGRRDFERQLVSRGGAAQGRVPRGVTTGGRFTAAQHMETGLRLG